MLPRHFRLPTCNKVYNIFHPHDPVAYRLEPLFDEQFKNKEPCLIEHYSGMRLHHQFKKVSAEISKGFAAVMKPTQSFFSSFFGSNAESSSSAATQSNESTAQSKDSSAPLTPHVWSALDQELTGIYLNSEKRIDYALQESPFENQMSPVAYMTALMTHSNYWTDRDFIQYVLKFC